MLCWSQTAALPLYAISPIEAVILSFGLISISNSYWDLDKFIDWILDHQRLVDSRFGFVQSVHIYREYVGGEENNTPWLTEESIVMGLENNRGIQNWVRVRIMEGSRERTSCVCVFCFRFRSHADVTDSR